MYGNHIIIYPREFLDTRRTLLYSTISFAFLNAGKKGLFFLTNIVESSTIMVFNPE